MDCKVSRKETRLQPGGAVEVLVDNVCDLFPVTAGDPRYKGVNLAPLIGIPTEDAPGYSFRVQDGNLLLEWDDSGTELPVPDAELRNGNLYLTAQNVDEYFIQDGGLFLLSGLDNYIMDIEMLDDSRAELLDRAMFALVKQRGLDPVEQQDGVQWAEAVLGEVPSPAILRQIREAVEEEGPGVRAVPSTVRNGREEHLVFKVELTGTV